MNAVATPSVGELQDTLRLVDGFSQAALGRISAMAALALRALETPEGCGAVGVDRIAGVLGAIAAMADDAMNDINCEAERLGCHFVDGAARRRGDAWRLYLSRQGSAT